MPGYVGRAGGTQHQGRGGRQDIGVLLPAGPLPACLPAALPWGWGTGTRAGHRQRGRGRSAGSQTPARCTGGAAQGLRPSCPLPHVLVSLRSVSSLPHVPCPCSPCHTPLTRPRLCPPVSASLHPCAPVPWGPCSRVSPVPGPHVSMFCPPAPGFVPPCPGPRDCPPHNSVCVPVSPLAHGAGAAAGLHVPACPAAGPGPTP